MFWDSKVKPYDISGCFNNILPQFVVCSKVSKPSSAACYKTTCYPSSTQILHSFNSKVSHHLCTIIITIHIHIIISMATHAHISVLIYSWTVFRDISRFIEIVCGWTKFSTTQQLTSIIFYDVPHYIVRCSNNTSIGVLCRTTTANAA